MALDFELSDEQKLIQATTREVLTRFEPRRKEFRELLQIIHAWEGVRLLRTAPVSREMILTFVAEHVLELPRSY